MKKNSIIALSLIASLSFVKAQNISSKKWTDLFSYNNVLALKEDNGRVVAATQNGIFFYNLSSGEISKLSKANGLHEVKISAFDYNPETKIGLVGYKSGALDIITPEGITYVVDIPIATGYTGDKKINHISINGDKAVISVGYGVSVFDLTRKEFGDTCFFGSNGVFEASNEAVIFDNKVFSVTNTGLKSHDFSVNFPVYTTWTNNMPGSFTQISAKSDITFSNTTQAYLYNNGANTPTSQAFTNITDIVSLTDKIVVTDKSRIYILNSNGTLNQATTVEEDSNTASLIGGKLFAGTIKSGLKDESKNTYKPDGPYYNETYKINLLDNNQLLVSSGARTDRYNGSASNPNNPGFYYFDGGKWMYASYFETSGRRFNVLDVVKNPTDESEFFVANYISGNNSNGVYKFKFNTTTNDFDFQKKYDLGAEDIVWYMRPVGFVKDEQNNVFLNVSMSRSVDMSYALGVYDRSIDDFKMNFTNIPISATQKPILYNNLLWLPFPRSADFAVYDYKNTALNFADDQNYLLTSSNGFPSNSNGIISFAADKDDTGWIGTNQGLRVLPNITTSIKNNPTVEPIIISQNGLGEELFRNTEILQIEVDEANNKWISVNGGGVYYLSPDGENTLKFFNMQNSPLPTNEVTDIKVDKKTGKVYFATYDGIVVYQGDVGELTSEFGNVLVYPNPVVQSTFKGNDTIKGLAKKTNIRITDAAGNLVHSAVSTSGYYEWNLNNQRGKRVASGIYYVLMTNADGSDKATAKIAVVN